MNEHKLIVVLGMHRSGTSVITRGLQVLGVDLGDIDGLTRSGEDNPKGFWEDADINQLNIEMLSFLQKEWDSLIPVLEEDVALLRENSYHTRALELLRNKTADKEIFGFKDPRVTKLLRFWKYVFIEGQWNVSYVIVVRNPLSVHKSLAHRNGFDPEKSYLLWLEHMINSLSDTIGENRILLDYDCLIQSPRRELEKIAAVLHLQIDLQLLEQFETEFLDKKLRHTIYSLEYLLQDRSVPPLVQEVYSLSLDAALDRIELENPAFQTKIEHYQKEFLALKSFLTFANRLILSNSDLTLKLNEKERSLDELTIKLAKADARIKQMNEVNEGLQTQISNLTLQISSLTLQISNLTLQISNLKIHLDNIWNSASWKVTRPLRFARYFWHRPKDASYDLGKYFFRKLPVSLRNRLMLPANWIVRKIKGNFSPKNPDLPPDVSWDEFQAYVLSKREQFKGIFIQEAIIDWGVPLYQRPQHLATSLGQLGYLVIYRTLNNLTDHVNGLREVAKNVWLTNCEQVNQIAGAVHSIYSTSFYIDFRSLHQNIHPERFLVYEYIDHIDPMISGTSENVKRILAMKEFAFNGGVDFIVASSRKLEAEAIAAVGKDKVLYLPNGVDVDHYRDTVHDTTRVSVDLTEFRKDHSHIIGYFGAVAPWLWYDAINELAHSRPDLGFVFIGPDYHYCIQRLPETKNVLYLGTIDYKILPAYARHFDVCFIPFAAGEIAHTTSPLKLFEYFALEKPVVTTSFMDECVAFPEVFHGDSVQSLSQAIDKAMAVKENPSYRSRLANLANENSWKERAKRFESVFYRSEGISIGEIQEIISRSYSDDGQLNNYYDEAYKFQEIYYWLPVPSWISQLENIKSIIDIGSAYGTLLLYSGLNHKVNSMVAIDPIEYMSPSLKKRYNIPSYQLDIEKDDIPRLGKFDLVIFTEVIEHLNFHPLPTLLKITELMHPDSYLVLSTPDAEEWGRITQYYETIDQIPAFSGQEQERIDGHIYQYTRQELDTLLIRAGFRIEKISSAPGVTKRHLCYLLKLDN